MKSFIVVAVLVCAAMADVSHILRGPKTGGSRYNPHPVPHPVPVPVSHGSHQHIGIVRFDNDVNPDGTYHYAYDTENGIHGDEQGSEHGAQGSFSFTSPEGEQVHIQYNADENGFQPQGSHIPTPPPVPEAIVRALEWIRAHPEPESKHQQPQYNKRF